METIDVANRIKKGQRRLEEMQSTLKERGINDAHSSSIYDKEICKTIIKLKNMTKDDTIEFEGEILHGPVQAVLIEKIAKGLCFTEKLNMETAKALYKSVHTNIDVTKTIVVADQTIYKHLDKV